MTDNSDYRLYLEEKFGGLTKHIHAQFENVHETLIAIKEQTTKTNGRVTELEGQITELDKAFATHPVDCNSAQEIRDIKKDLEEYRIIKKYPKIALLIIAFFVLTTMISIFQAINASRQLGKAETSLGKKVDNLGTPVLSNPRGLLIRPSDSLGVKFFPRDFVGDTSKNK